MKHCFKSKQLAHDFTPNWIKKLYNLWIVDHSLQTLVKFQPKQFEWSSYQCALCIEDRRSKCIIAPICFHTSPPFYQKEDRKTVICSWNPPASRMQPMNCKITWVRRFEAFLHIPSITKWSGCSSIARLFYVPNRNDLRTANIRLILGRNF